ncbi:MAG: tetratricopeptide repeat protein [Spirochaetota bacterium]
MAYLGAGVRRELFALLLLLLGVVLVPPGAVSQEFEIVLLEGEAYTRDEGSWRRVDVGNTLRNEAVVRLGNGGYVEIGHREGVLRIARPGTYELASLRRATSRARSDAVREAISRRFRQVLAERYDGAAESDSDDRLIAEGLRALRQNQPEGAYNLFAEARANVSADRRRDLRVLQALAARASGNYQQSLQLLDAEGGSLADERALVKADVLLELSAFSEAVEMAERYLRHSGRTPSERQVASALKAQALAGMGNLGAAMATFEDAIAFDPLSDVGRAAREHLEALR